MAVETPNLSVVLTIRLLMQGKEVGSIIGKRGDHIKVIRDESGAKINISDGSCPERIVTITGNLDTISKAFTMICHKFEDDMTQLPVSVPKPPITFRLIVPATQCGSLIGKGGAKIKEIRDASGASLQVASEMLPNSTERAVTISGMANAIIQCMFQICQILLESPPKGATISYRPKPSVNPLLLASSAAAAAAAAQQQPSITSNAAAIYNQLAANELTKIHSAYNPLLQPIPGFNPAVINGSSTNPYGAGLIQLQGAAGTQHHFIQAVNESALNSVINGSYGRTLDVRPFNGMIGAMSAATSRDEAQKMQQTAALMTAAAAGVDAHNLSQYLSTNPLSMIPHQHSSPQSAQSSSMIGSGSAAAAFLALCQQQPQNYPMQQILAQHQMSQLSSYASSINNDPGQGQFLMMAASPNFPAATVMSSSSMTSTTSCFPPIISCASLIGQNGTNQLVGHVTNKDHSNNNNNNIIKDIGRAGGSSMNGHHQHHHNNNHVERTTIANNSSTTATSSSKRFSPY